jgi:hypothetical protein
MGLALEVGILADLKEADPEGFEYHAAALARLNRFLESRELPPHCEPDDCEVWSGETIGYSGLHDLRRLAAYLDCDAPLPTPGGRTLQRIHASVATTLRWMDADQVCFSACSDRRRATGEDSITSSSTVMRKVTISRQTSPTCCFLLRT